MQINLLWITEVVLTSMLAQAVRGLH